MYAYTTLRKNEVSGGKVGLAKHPEKFEKGGYESGEENGTGGYLGTQCSLHLLLDSPPSSNVVLVVGNIGLSH